MPKKPRFFELELLHGHPAFGMTQIEPSTRMGPRVGGAGQLLTPLSTVTDAKYGSQYSASLMLHVCRLPFSGNVW
eukprot:6860574-Pyramimonas_sp.AAC.1